MPFARPAAAGAAVVSLVALLSGCGLFSDPPPVATGNAEVTVPAAPGAGHVNPVLDINAHAIAAVSFEDAAGRPIPIRSATTGGAEDRSFRVSIVTAPDRDNSVLTVKPVSSSARPTDMLVFLAGIGAPIVISLRVADDGPGSMVVRVVR